MNISVCIIEDNKPFYYCSSNFYGNYPESQGVIDFINRIQNKLAILSNNNNFDFNKTVH